MRNSIFSEHWYRVAQLRPALREHASILRHRYRGEDWWIIRDPITNRQHRLSRVAHFLVARMDGNSSVEEIWNEAIGQLDDEAPGQGEIIELLSDLHNADLLKTDVNPDTAELFKRFERRKGEKNRRAIANPLYLKFPLWDPDALLKRLQPLSILLFSRAVLIIWAVVVSFAGILAFAHWEQLAGQSLGSLLSPGNLLVMALVFPLMKLLHELGHGLAVKRWGGEVHDMGITLLVLLPVPYVDASAAAAFPDKQHRMLVGAIGIMVEALLASLALFVWLLVEPGLVSQTALAVALIGGVSTLLINGNPLLKFDAYYVLSDAIEIPNLASRSSRYLAFLAQRTLFEMEDEPSPAQSRSEAAWLAAYGIGAFCYRLVILMVIAIYLSSEFLLAGVLLAVWALVVQLALPLARGVARLVQLSRSHRQRLRVVGASAVAFGLVWLLVFSVPFPSTTYAEGVVWVSDRSIVRAGTDCFVTATLAESGDPVEIGQPLIECEDPVLAAEKNTLSARIQSLQLEYRGHALREQVKRRILADEIAALAAELKMIQQRTRSLTVRAATAGSFLIPDNVHLPGRFLRQGDLVGYVVSPNSLTLRTAVTQEEIDLVRERTAAIEFRMASTPRQTHETRVQRHLPAAADRLPTAALGIAGGGRLAVDPTDGQATLLNQDVFLVDLTLDHAAHAGLIGERAYVLFNHHSEALAEQWKRSLRLLFLRQFSV